MRRDFGTRCRKGEILLGTVVGFAEPALIEVIAPHWDWIWIDCQHGSLDTQSMRGCVDTCHRYDLPCVVRVPCLDDGDILHVLDSGADGVMVPMVNTAAAAVRAVNAAKFPPLGSRSLGAQRLLIREGVGYAANANDETLLIVQLETSTAMENLEEIASVPGVDVLLLGPWDLAMSLGYRIDQGWPDGFLQTALTRLMDASERHNKISAGFLSSEDDVRLGLQYKCSLLCVAIDFRFICQGSKDCADRFRQILAAT